MTITFASLFTGGGGADLGAIAAGLTPIMGIEKDPSIAWVGHNNIHPLFPEHRVLVGDIKTVLWESEERPDWLHASPPCVRASTANNGKESPEDVELLQSVYLAIKILQPKYFSLENVPGYKDFLCFRVLVHNLGCLRYKWSWRVLDASNFGVPQSRKRLFLIASKKIDCTYFFDRFNNLKSSIGWYEAIADLIPTLEPTKLTSSQSQSLVNSHKVLTNLIETDFGFKQVPDLVIQRSGARKKDGIYANTIRLSDEPMFTIKSMSGNVRPSVQQATLIVDGKRLKPDIRCYARWQTFPDSYQWPADFKLAMKICGNAVPPRMMEAVINAVNPWT